MGNDHHLDDDQKDRLLRHALGTISAPEDAAVVRHLAAGCATCGEALAALRRALALLAFDAKPRPAPDRLRGRLLDAVIADDGRGPLAETAPKKRPIESDRPEGAERTDAPARSAQAWREWPASDVARDALWVRRGADARWEETSIPGIRARRLFVDVERDVVTMLIRMEAGTAYPAHVHGGPEECLVLDGELHVGEELVMTAGDFQRMEKGAVHPRQWTETGCTLFITSSRHDELIA